MNTGKKQGEALRANAVFEALPAEEYGFSMREAKWVWAQPIRSLPTQFQYSRAFCPMNTGKKQGEALRANAVFEAPPAEEYGFSMREAKWVWAQPTEFVK